MFFPFLFIKNDVPWMKKMYNKAKKLGYDSIVLMAASERRAL
jgi:hypothetical protein